MWVVNATNVNKTSKKANILWLISIKGSKYAKMNASTSLSAVARLEICIGIFSNFFMDNCKIK